MIPEESRFAASPDELVDLPATLPDGWDVQTPDAEDQATVDRLTELLRAHEAAGRGWAGAGVDEIMLEVSAHGMLTRENVVVRDADGLTQAWGSVHDRAGGRMMFVHVVARDLDDRTARACSQVLVDWAVAQAKEVGAARGLDVQQIDTGAFADDERQHRFLRSAGFEMVRTWWQMSRPVTPEEASLVPDPAEWDGRDVTVRLVRRTGDGMPDDADLREMHEVLESAFTDHFNSHEETFEEFLHRLRQEPGHRWHHWWLAELTDEVAAGGEPKPVGALVGEVSEGGSGPDGSYVSYLGVLEAARGRGVAKGLLNTIIADAAARGRDRVGLEVDADSPTGAADLYVGMGWETRYVTQSWHRDVPVD